MTDKNRWSVRGISNETLEMLSIVRQNSAGTLGDYINEAVSLWYSSLPNADEKDDNEAA